jgi:hypothetical protein
VARPPGEGLEDERVERAKNERKIGRHDHLPEALR